MAESREPFSRAVGDGVGSHQCLPSGKAVGFRPNCS